MTAHRIAGLGLLMVMCAIALNGQVRAAEEQRWAGRWGSPHCAADSTQIVLSRDTLDLSTFEATCAVQAVEKAGDVTVIKAQCAGEEGPYPIALSLRVSGKRLTFIEQTGFEFDPKSYVRCR